MPIIKAYFNNMLNANKAVQALKGSGYKGAHLDMPHKYSTEFSSEISITGTKHSPDLFSAFLKPGRSNAHVGKAPLVAADPSISGTGSSQEIIDNSRASLIIDIGEENTDAVKGIIKEFGGNI